MNKSLLKLTFLLTFLSLILSSCSYSTKEDNSKTPSFNNPADTISQESYYKSIDSPLRINELMPANDDLKDKDGNDPGWVEICNSSDNDINLKGYYLSEKLDSAKFWAFPNSIVEANACIYVFASGKDISIAEDATDSLKSIDVLTPQTQAWAWADSEEGPDRFSTWDYNEISGSVAGMLDGEYSLSVSFDHKANSAIPAWTTAMMIASFETILVGIQDYESVTIKATIAKGERINARFIQQDLNDWEGWVVPIVGTGIAKDEYTIILPNSSMNKSEVYGIRFEMPQGDYRTMDLTIQDIVLHSSAAIKPINHTSFKLERDGGSLFLIDSLDYIHDQISYPKVPFDASFGRLEENPKSTFFFKPPTPGEANTSATALAKLAGKPVVGPSSGFYKDSISVFFATEDRDLIRYTTDGSEPNINSTIWNGLPLTFNKTTMIKLKAWQANGQVSKTQVAHYFIDEKEHKIPIFSITTDVGALFDPDTGIYVLGHNAKPDLPYYGANYWLEKELPINITMFENGQNLTWQHDAGLQIFGNYSRTNDKKSVSIHFREQYGDNKLIYPLFPQAPNVLQFKSFVLRNAGNGFYTDHVRDALGSSLLKDDMQVDYQKHRYAAVYYNGEYWGIHNIREKLTADYFWSNYDLDKSGLDIKKTVWEMQNGSIENWNQLERTVNRDLSIESNYHAALELMNTQNFTNYMIWEMYLVNQDWPANNWKAWRSDALPEHNKWNWAIYDLDFCFGQFGASFMEDMIEWATNDTGEDYPNGPKSTLVFRGLLTSPHYKMQFINRNAVLLSTRLHATNINLQMDKLLDELSSEEQFDLKRWGHDPVEWEKNKADIRQFIDRRASYYISDLQYHFDLDELVNVQLIATPGGKIQVHQEDIPNDALYLNSNTIQFFKGHLVEINALADVGRTFVGWSDGETNATRIITPIEGLSLSAIFN